MRIKEAKWEDGWLKLKTADVDARHFAYKFKSEGDWELKPKKELRSLDANAYMWVLCEKIAKAVGSTKEDIYRDAIRDVGVWRDFHMVDESEAKSMRAAWERLGIGWVTEQVDFEQDGDHVVIRAYYGSSVYSRRQLSRVIDNLIQDAKAVGVETMPPEQLESLMRQWEERYESKKQ
jgi:hypothetical protein